MHGAVNKFILQFLLQLNLILEFEVSLVIGVPTIKRNQESYLMNTLDSLIYSLSETEKEDVLIVVSICEVILLMIMNMQTHSHRFPLFKHYFSGYFVYY